MSLLLCYLFELLLSFCKNVQSKRTAVTTMLWDVLNSERNKYVSSLFWPFSDALSVLWLLLDKDG